MHELNATYRVQAAFKDTTGDLVKRVYAVQDDTATSSQQRISKREIQQRMKYRNARASYASGELGCPPPKVVTVLIGSNDLDSVNMRSLLEGVPDPDRENAWNYHDRYAPF
jgi:hypothetical protein